MKIKNCPFCGSEVELKKLPLWDGSHGYYGCYEYVISCDNCGCRKHLGNNNTVYNTDEEAKQNAIDSWNMRRRIRMTKEEKNKELERISNEMADEILRCPLDYDKLKDLIRESMDIIDASKYRK